VPEKLDCWFKNQESAFEHLVGRTTINGVQGR
jgi:hypothetical protein